MCEDKMKFSVLFKLFRRKIIGSLKDAQRQGMIVEDGVTVMGGVNFGSEPYLITLRKNCRISSMLILLIMMVVHTHLDAGLNTHMLLTI